MEDQDGRSDMDAPTVAEAGLLPDLAHADGPANDPIEASEAAIEDGTCPFLRVLDSAGHLGVPIGLPDADNRCVAIGDPTPQSARQQELVCLTIGHLNCPRYLRGSLVMASSTRRSRRDRLSRPIIAANLVLVAAIAASVGFVFARGGLTLPPGTVGSKQIAVATQAASAVPSAPPVVTSSPTPFETAGPTRQPTPPPSPTPTAAPTPQPTLAPTPAPTAKPAVPAVPKSNRYAFLDPCPGTPSCWIYTVRAGDNFQSIVDWFGVPYATVVRMNPQIGDPATIRKGDRIRMPAPTR